MKTISKHFNQKTKKALAIILTLALVVTNFAVLFSFTTQAADGALYAPIEGQGVTNYLVKTESPAIPMIAGTIVDPYYLDFEIAGQTVEGADVSILLNNPSNDGVTFTNGVLFANRAGVYPASVTYGESTITVYVVVKNDTDTAWYLYNQDFTGITATSFTDVAIPTGWSAQAATNQYNGSSTALFDYTHVAANSSYKNTDGIVPLYDSYHLANGTRYQVGFFTLNNAVVNAFADYTINMNVNAYSHYPDNANTGIGLYGRLPLGTSGKLDYNDGANHRFSVFAANPATNKDGTAGTKTGNVYATTYNEHSFIQKDPVAATDTLSSAYLTRINTDDVANIPMSLKYEGSNATYTAGNVTHTFDLTTMNDSDPETAGAVGMFVYMANDYTQYNDTWAAMKTFSVTLNNSGNNCPAYYYGIPVVEDPTEGGLTNYTVTSSSPAIPVNINTYVDLSAINFTISGVSVNGDDVQITCNDSNVIIADGTIYVRNVGVYEATVSYGADTQTVYIVSKKLNDDSWYIYYEDFTKDNYAARDFDEIAIPEGWKSQYAQSTTTITLGDFEYVGPYSLTKNVEEGIIPFYDTYWLSLGRNQGGTFTLNDPIVKSFSDYTISMESMLYNHQPDTSWAGVGLFGRAPIGETGKIANTSGRDRFTIFAVNNAAKADGTDGTYSRDVWQLTVGDGFYEQDKEVLGKADVNVSCNNTNELVSVPMSLKYEGNNAIFTAGNTSYTFDLANANDDNYTENGAVGVAGYRISDGSQYYDVSFALQKFMVALNNSAEECPYYVCDNIYRADFTADSDVLSLVTLENTSGKSAAISFDYYLANTADTVTVANGLNTLGTLSEGFNTFSYSADELTTETFNAVISSSNASAMLYIWNIRAMLDGAAVELTLDTGSVIPVKTSLDTIPTVNNMITPIADPNSTEDSVYTLDVLENMGINNTLQSQFDTQANAMYDVIDSNPDDLVATGDSFYVSNDGDDSNAGTILAPFATIAEAISHADSGDVIFLNRGDLWRETGLTLPVGVSMGAYGTGPKPAIYGSPMNYANATWSETSTPNVYSVPVGDAINIGNVIFNHGQATAKYQFSLEAVDSPFDFYANENYLYLYSELGNPAYVWDDIEFASGKNGIKITSNSTIQNIRIMYVGSHGVWACGDYVALAENNVVEGLIIGYVGGSLQPGSTEENPIRYGNGVELWGYGDGFTVTNCHIYQMYDTAVTVQYTTGTLDAEGISNVEFKNNLLEYNLYGVEYWLGDTKTISNFNIEGNIIRYSGYGWCETTRPDSGIAKAISGQTYLGLFGQSNITIKNNILDMSYAKSYHDITDLVTVFEHNNQAPDYEGNIYAQFDYNNFARVAYWSGETYTSTSYGAADVLTALGDTTGTVVTY